MKDGEHHHNQGDPEGKHNHRKLAGIILVAIMFAIVAYGVAQTSLDTANTNNIFAIVVNNTDLYPTQRTNHTVYWANESPIAVYILFHAIDVATPQHFDSNFTINGSVVLDKDFNSAAGSGAHEHWSFYTIVPKGANYSVTNSTNVYQIEWREYPILSGKNGTLSVNQTFVATGTSFNATYDQTTKSFNSNYSAQTFPNSSINDTILRNNTPHIYTNFFQRDMSLASGTQSVTGIGFKPSKADFHAVVASAQYNYSTGFDDLAHKNAIIALPNLPGAYTFTATSSIFVYTDATTSNNYKGNVQSFDSDGFTITWTKTGSTSGTLTIFYQVYR